MTSRSFHELVDLIARLRDPVQGCPWDRAQDHHSLRPYMLEEAYEAIAAIDAGDPTALASELGDVLLQVLLHRRIASEKGEFTVEDVIAGLTEKLIRRHPHVFGEASDDLPSIHRRWEEIKSGEHHVATAVPTLVRARKAVSRSEDVGSGEGPVFDDLGESPEERAGARILSMIDAAWRQGFDPELALRKALDRFDEGAAG